MWRHRFAIVLLVGLTSPWAAANEPVEDPLAPLAFLVGEWKGEEKAVFGRGDGHRTYRFVLGGRFLHADNHSVFPPQEGLPEGDDHRDWEIIGYDAARKTHVLRQFTSEGYVNRMVLDPDSRVPEEWIFVSEASENAPPGLRVRLTLTRVSGREFREVFELATPGEDFSVLIRNRWSKESSASP